MHLKRKDGLFTIYAARILVTREPSFDLWRVAMACEDWRHGIANPTSERSIAAAAGAVVVEAG